MRRREFITLLGGAAAWSLAARAQQPNKIYRIGFLASDPTIPAQPAGRVFLDGLRESGFVEGKNIIIERRFAEGRIDRFDSLAAELVRLNLDVMVTSPSEATEAAKKTTKTIPIVMLNVTDPVGLGIVTSLAHPGGNVTGLSQSDSAQIVSKRLQQLTLAAPSLNLKVSSVVVRDASEFENAFAEIAQHRPDALLVATSSLHFANRKLIMELAIRNRLPDVSNWKEATDAGGLMSYGFDRVDQFRRAAIYVSKILKGAKPADLPVEQPTKYELVINLKTARSLKLEISRDLLLVADEVIE
jgi:putative tryptophan/tyrosine transport system substrate-binding protein